MSFSRRSVNDYFGRLSDKGAPDYERRRYFFGTLGHRAPDEYDVDDNGDDLAEEYLKERVKRIGTRDHSNACLDCCSEGCKGCMGRRHRHWVKELLLTLFYFCALVPAIVLTWAPQYDNVYATVYWTLSGNVVYATYFNALIPFWISMALLFLIHLVQMFWGSPGTQRHGASGMSKWIRARRVPVVTVVFPLAAGLILVDILAVASIKEALTYTFIPIAFSAGLAYLAFAERENLSLNELDAIYRGSGEDTALKLVNSQWWSRLGNLITGSILVCVCYAVIGVAFSHYQGNAAMWATVVGTGSIAVVYVILKFGMFLYRPKPNTMLIFNYLFHVSFVICAFVAIYCNSLMTKSEAQAEIGAFI